MYFAHFNGVTKSDWLVFCNYKLINLKHGAKRGQEEMKHFRAYRSSKAIPMVLSLAHWRLTEQLGNTDSWEPPQSPTEPRCSSLPLSPLSPFSFTISISSTTVEKYWQSCVPVVKWLFSPISFPLTPDVAILVWCQNYANFIGKTEKLNSRNLSIIFFSFYCRNIFGLIIGTWQKMYYCEDWFSLLGDATTICLIFRAPFFLTLTNFMFSHYIHESSLWSWF